MVFSDRPARIKVPATCANLGPGYDAFGLAVSRYDEVVASIVDAGLHVSVTGCGAGEVALDEQHLVIRSMRAAFDRLGAQPPGVQLDCLNAIPHGRGLGSSAAAIIAGIEVARTLTVDGHLLLDDAGALALATELEGHPDNVAACLLGGLTIAWLDGGVGRAAQVAVTGVRPVLFIPEQASATHAARAALPLAVPHVDAAFNLGRAALLVVALTGRPELLLAATADRLHQPYRAAGMPASAELVEALRASGIAAVVSGAGSSVLVLATDQQQVGTTAALAPAGWECAELTVAEGVIRTYL